MKLITLIKSTSILAKIKFSIHFLSFTPERLTSPSVLSGCSVEYEEQHTKKTLSEQQTDPNPTIRCGVRNDLDAQVEESLSLSLSLLEIPPGRLPLP